MVLVVALTSLACGQQEGISLSGTVQDPSGSRIPHANVYITDEETAFIEATTAGEAGAFRIGGLAPSPSYQIEVFGPLGFEPYVAGLELSADQHLDVVLNIQPIVESIVISGQRPEPESGPPRGPPRRIRIGGNVRRAKLVHYVPPQYPAEAEREGVEGTVHMEAAIGTEGRLVGLSTLNSTVDERLVTAASEAVLQWQYEPTLLNGQPVDTPVTLSVAFELP